MPDEIIAVIAVLIVAAVTMGTRMAGVWIVSSFRNSSRLERFLEHMSTSVLVAIVVPATLIGGPRAWFAVALAALAMAVTGSTTSAVILGVCAAALARGVGF